jgi:Ran GTPase-activating protein (RanGAP) involved in mRNA processing and transport
VDPRGCGSWQTGELEEGAEDNASPREQFIHYLLESQHLPTAGEILRRSADAHFNIAHKGIGDEYMIVLAKSLPKLPMIRHVNVADNRLTDASLCEVIRAVSEMPGLRSLDLSSNTIDEKASEMLRHYLSSRAATITKLKMSKADIDDDECNAFVHSIADNKNLTYIDISHNLIG